MSISSATQWEMRATASGDKNGGCFDSTFGGADLSLQNSPQLTITDLVGNGTTTLTSATGSFTANMRGNGLVDVTTGIWYQITAFTNSTTITVDKASGTFSGHTANIGGANKLINNGFAFVNYAEGGNTVWFNGTLQATTTNAPTWSKTAPITAPIRLRGYGSTRGDSGRATINGSFEGLLISADNIIVENLICDGAAGGVAGLRVTGGGNVIDNCICYNGTNALLVSGNDNTLRNCDLAGNGVNGIVANLAGFANLIENCTIRSSVNSHGISMTTDWVIQHCIIRNNNQDGINNPAGANGGSRIRFCDIWANGRDGIRLLSTGGALWGVYLEGNILGANTGYELNYSPSDLSATEGGARWAQGHVRNNAYYSTGSGARNNLPAGTADLTLSANPFTNAAGGVFSLNATAGGGALVTANPMLVAFADGLNTGNYTLGALGSPGNLAPTAPSALVATAVSGYRVDLSWTDNSADEVRFFIERQTNGGGFTQIATVAAGTTSYSDTTVQPGNTYGYRVQGVN
jgi:hypothetical protein